jgi:hypothetical protein
MLTYRRSDRLEIIGYTDSNFAGCQDSKKSTIGYFFMLSRGAISWKSANQSFIATSTMKAEFISYFQASNQAIWLCNFVTGLRIMETIQSPLKIYYDNNSALSYSNNNRSSSKSKHIDIKFLTVKEIVHNGLISIEHIGTDLMIIDSLTMGLIPKVFHGHVARMSIVSAEDVRF